MCDRNSSSVTDALVVSARSDREAFGRLYEAFYERILRYCQRRLFERSAAEDVCGEVFLFVARNMQSFRGTTEQDFRRWVYRIATTEVNAYVRRTRRRKELWDDALQMNRLLPKDSTEITDTDESTDWASIYHAISQLSTKEQSVVTLRLFEDMSYEEIAQVLRIRLGSARVVYSRAIKKLRAMLLVDSSKTDDRTI